MGLPHRRRPRDNRACRYTWVQGFGPATSGQGRSGRGHVVAMASVSSVESHTDGRDARPRPSLAAARPGAHSVIVGVAGLVGQVVAVVLGGMSMERKKVLTTLAVLTTLVLSCITIEVQPAQETAVRTMAPPSPTWTTVVTREPAVTPIASAVVPVPTVPNWPVVLADDFDDPESGFLSTSDEQSRLSYEDGQYSIGVIPERWVAWSSQSGYVSDFVAEVRVSAEAEVGFAGLIFRKQGDSQFYIFAVAPDGQYTLTTSSPAAGAILDWRDSSYIETGANPNRLRVVCVGATVSLYVNGQCLDTVQDATFSEGEVGMIAGTRAGETHALFHFDNLRVYAPTPVAPLSPTATSPGAPTATQVPVPPTTIPPSPTIAQATATRGPTEFDPVVFAQGLTADADPIMPSMTFPPGTTEVYAVWACRGMYQGLEMLSIWRLNGQVYAQSTQYWEKTAERGRWWLRLYRESGQPLPSGNYRVELFMGAQLLQSGTFTIQ
jgi:hypothetical protein